MSGWPRSTRRNVCFGLSFWAWGDTLWDLHVTGPMSLLARGRGWGLWLLWCCEPKRGAFDSYTLAYCDGVVRRWALGPLSPPCCSRRRPAGGISRCQKDSSRATACDPQAALKEKKHGKEARYRERSRRRLKLKCVPCGVWARDLWLIGPSL